MTGWPWLSASSWYRDEPLAPSEARERSISLLQVPSSYVLDFFQDPASAGRSVAPLHPRRQTVTIVFALGCAEAVRIVRALNDVAGAHFGMNMRRVPGWMARYIISSRVSPAETAALLTPWPGINPPWGAGNGPFASAAPVGGAAVARASVFRRCCRAVLTDV